MRLEPASNCSSNHGAREMKEAGLQWEEMKQTPKGTHPMCPTGREQPALSSFPGQWTVSAKLKKVPGKLGRVGHLMKNSWNPALFLYLILGEILLLICIFLVRVSVVLKSLQSCLTLQPCGL